MTDDFIYVGGEILPCPFCGSDGMIYLSGQGTDECGNIVQYYTASCTVCAIENHKDFFSYEEAKAEWNKRKEVRCVAED